MSCPHRSQCTHLRGPSVFFNRKGFYAIVCQAVCDARRRFIFVSASSEGRYRLARFSTFISELTRLTRNLPPLLLPPCLSPPWTRLPSVYSCPDSISFAQTALGTRMAAIPPPRPFKLVGDAAYEAEPWMLTPYPGTKLPADKDAFNYYQSSYRIEIECAFGLLCRRWGVMWRPLSGGSIAEATNVIVACCKLHNFCIDRGDVQGPDVSDDTMLEPQSDFHPQDECEDLDLSRPHRRKRMKECNIVRDDAARKISEMNGRRPSLTGNRVRRPGEATCA